MGPLRHQCHFLQGEAGLPGARGPEGPPGKGQPGLKVWNNLQC